MANANAPFGLKPIRGQYSQPHNDGIQPYSKLAADSSVIRYGDPVVVTGTADADGVPSVTLATAGTGNQITGTAVGFRPKGATEWLGYAPASTDYYVLVEDNPDLELLVQEDSNGGALAAADVGLNVNVVFGTATGNRSAAMIASNSKATTAGHQLRLMGLYRTPGNEFGNYAIWRVRINNTNQTPNAGNLGA